MYVSKNVASLPVSPVSEYTQSISKLKLSHQVMLKSFHLICGPAIESGLPCSATSVICNSKIYKHQHYNLKLIWGGLPFEISISL